MKYKKVSPPKKITLSKSLIIEGEAFHALQILPSNSVQCVVTSPPYWGLRDYNIKGQIGLEPTLPQFLNHLVAIFNEVKRVLKDDGILWLNIGDGYTSGNRATEPIPAISCSKRANLARVTSFSNGVLKTPLCYWLIYQ
jgi:site-specific DNA-methyltransferase (cytosine-N4-specific)